MLILRRWRYLLLSKAEKYLAWFSCCILQKTVKMPHTFLLKVIFSCPFLWQYVAVKADFLMHRLSVLKCQQRQIWHCSKTEELNFSVLFSTCYLTVSFGVEWFCYCEKRWIIIPYSPFLHHFKIIYLRLLFSIDSFMLCSFNIFNIMSCLGVLFSTLDGPSLFCLTSISVMRSSKFPLFEMFLVLLYYSSFIHTCFKQQFSMTPSH